MRNANIVIGNNVSCLGWETTLKIESNSCVEITLSLFDLSCLGLLVCVNEPLEVILLKLSNVRMIFLLGNLDTLIPSV